MKTFKPGYPTGRNMQNINTVPWMQALPMALRNCVSSKSDKTMESICLQEMALMYTCMKNNEFRDKLCVTEISTYRSCVFKHLKQKEERKEQLVAGKLTPNTKEPSRLNFRQLNILLRRFPQFNTEKAKRKEIK